MAGTTAQPAKQSDPTPPPIGGTPLYGDLSSLDALTKAVNQGRMADETAANLVQSHAKVMNDIADSMKGDIADIQKLGDPPAAPNLPPPPQPKFSTPMEEFGSIASTLGIFASLLTRRPLTSALNASAAAMKSIQQADYQGYQTAMDQWKANTDYAQNTADWQYKRYQAILDNKTLTMSAKENMIRAMQSGDSDLVGAQQLRDHGLDGVMKLQEYRLKMALAAERAANRVGNINNTVFWGYTQQAMDAAVKANGGKPLSQDQMAKVYTDAYTQYKQASASGSATNQHQTKAVTDANKTITDMMTALQGPNGAWLTGVTGELKGGLESLETFLSRATPGKALPATTFKADLARLRLLLPVILAAPGRTNEYVQSLVGDIAPGLQWGATAQQTYDSLQKLQEVMPDFSPTGTTSGAPDMSGVGGRQWATDGSGTSIYTEDGGASWFNEDGSPYDGGQ